MKIVLFGYGKMGKEIEAIAIERGHEIHLRINSENINTVTPEQIQTADAAIEFSRPENAINNIYKCFEANLAVVVGTTGWYDQFNEVAEKCESTQQALLHATNFSIGVNIFFEINQKLARLLNPYPEYEVTLEETHHIHKLDAPSGTAITLAEGIIQNIDRKNKWVKEDKPTQNELAVLSHRIDNVPGTHHINYSSEIDDIDITHTAHNRKGFALGSVIAAEWLHHKKGVYTMQDVLK